MRNPLFRFRRWYSGNADVHNDCSVLYHVGFDEPGLTQRCYYDIGFAAVSGKVAGSAVCQCYGTISGFSIS